MARRVDHGPAQRAMEAFLLFSAGWDYPKIARKLKVSTSHAYRYVKDAKKMLSLIEGPDKRKKRAALNDFFSILGKRKRLEHYRKDESKPVLSAFFSLTRAQVRTFELYFVKEIPSTRIAKKEGTCVSAIVRRIIRIRQKFKDHGLAAPANPRSGARDRRGRFLSMGSMDEL